MGAGCETRESAPTGITKAESRSHWVSAWRQSSSPDPAGSGVGGSFLAVLGCRQSRRAPVIKYRKNCWICELSASSTTLNLPHGMRNQRLVKLAFA